MGDVREQDTQAEERPMDEMTATLLTARESLARGLFTALHPQYGPDGIDGTNEWWRNHCAALADSLLTSSVWALLARAWDEGAWLMASQEGIAPDYELNPYRQGGAA